MSESHPKTWTNYCKKLDKIVTLDWYATNCECGDEIIGVPAKPKDET